MSHPLRCYGLVATTLMLALALPHIGLAEEAKGTGPEPILLWPSGAPGESQDADPEEQQPLRPGDSTIRITNVSRPTLTVFQPKPEQNTGASVLICPGGGYKILAFNKEGTEVAEWLNKLGVTAFVLKYRVPATNGRERHEAPIQDAQRALRLIRHRVSEWKLDPNRIGVLGFSAGGHLAALLSTNSVPSAYEPRDEVDRVNARPDFSILVYPAYLATKTDTLAAPVQVDAKTPATFLVQTEDDGVRVESSIVYYLALKQAKVSAEMHLYPRGGHGYGLRPSKDPVSSWPLRAEAWMKSTGILKPVQ